MSVKHRPIRPNEHTRSQELRTPHKTPARGPATKRSLQPSRPRASHVSETSGPSAPWPLPCPSDQADRIRAGFVTYLVSFATGVDVARIHAPTRQTAQVARARQIAMYLTHVGFSWPMGRVGAAFGRDRTTASYACHRVEDWRDQPGFDAVIDSLEACVRAAPDLRSPSL